MTVRATQLLRYLWALPASAIGLLLGSPAVLLGAARLAVHTGVLEITLPARPRPARRPFVQLPFSAITFGHVVIAANPAAQRQLRRHERVHVAQYERWGPLFLLAYPAESLFQLLTGGRPYFDNRFELEARTLSQDAAGSAAEEQARRHG